MNKIANVDTPIEGLPVNEPDVPQAWRVIYSPVDAPARTGGGQIHRIRGPQPMLAVTESIVFADAMEQPRLVDGDNALTLVWLPSTPASGRLEQEVQTWLGNSDDVEIVRGSIRTVRVAWTSDRCVIFSPAEQFADAMDAVLRFTLAKRQTNSLESRMADVWSDLPRDVPLSRNVPFWRRARRRLISERTDRITEMNAELLCLQTVLEQLDIKLSSASKRLYAELVLQATIYDRLEVMEDPVEFVMDHYELANTRLIETRNSWTDHWLEIGIILLLGGQITLQLLGH